MTTKGRELAEIYMKNARSGWIAQIRLHGEL